ncbi:hypothetical protein FRC02_012101 [Tulasnella sp. 418]|nr:hypothetical protein FRC02_012101 [Tulasnella sp. 418]
MDDSTIGKPITYSSGPYAGRTIRAELHEYQKPDLGRKFAKRDRRPLDPPPVVRLRLWEVFDLGLPTQSEHELHADDIDIMGLVAHIDLFPAPDPNSNNPIPDTSNSLTTSVFGSSFVHAVHMLDMTGQPVVFFVWADVSVRLEGSFALRYRFFDLLSHVPNSNAIPVAAELYSGPFTVYSTKEFPGLQASTPLTKHLSRWGVRVNLREGERRRKPISGGRARSDDDDDEDDEDDDEDGGDEDGSPGAGPSTGKKGGRGGGKKGGKGKGGGSGAASRGAGNPGAAGLMLSDPSPTQYEPSGSTGGYRFQQFNSSGPSAGSSTIPQSSSGRGNPESSKSSKPQSSSSPSHKAVGEDRGQDHHSTTALSYQNQAGPSQGHAAPSWSRPYPTPTTSGDSWSSRPPISDWSRQPASHEERDRVAPNKRLKTSSSSTPVDGMGNGKMNEIYTMGLSLGVVPAPSSRTQAQRKLSTASSSATMVVSPMSTNASAPSGSGGRSTRSSDSSSTYAESPVLPLNEGHGQGYAALPPHSTHHNYHPYGSTSNSPSLSVAGVNYGHSQSLHAYHHPHRR